MKRQGFTLIELLVVISIIALLIAILLPSLGQAKHQARVVTCSTNLRMFAIGLINYASDSHSASYPFHPADLSGALLSVYSPHMGINAGIDKDAWLTMYTDVVLGGNPTVGWCPVMDPGNKEVFWPSWGGSRTPWKDPNYPDYFFGGSDHYWVGYAIFAAHDSPSYYSGDYMDYTFSGNANTDVAPMRPGPSQDAILADEVSLQVTAGGIVYRDAHSDELERIVPSYAGVGGAYRENNVAYGDGHVETHKHSMGDPASLPGSWTGHYVTRGGEPWLY